MKTCFVIQPFDKDKFDKRYSDIYEPAIKKTGLNPYRVDNDFTARILIDEIEKNIESADIVFADITLDNPNVWYELGYAFAKKKDTIMICCTDERKTEFPFDIRHRSIIPYKTGSPSDYRKLENDIYEKITAYLSTAKTVEKLVETPINEIEGLKSHEVALLLLLVEKQNDPSHHISGYALSNDMEKAGYNKLATNIGLRALCIAGFLAKFEVQDQQYDNESYIGYNLSTKGEEWIMSHQHLMKFDKVL